MKSEREGTTSTSLRNEGISLAASGLFHHTYPSHLQCESVRGCCRRLPCRHHPIEESKRSLRELNIRLGRTFQPRPGVVVPVTFKARRHGQSEGLPTHVNTLILHFLQHLQR